MKRMAAVASAASRVCFLTDIEGNWSYVRNVVRASQCLRFRDAHERELALRDDCVLVFGGDAGDKGDDTLHCYEQLVRLQREHPDRVVLLVGNRDVNKMRFTSELHASELELHTMAPEIRDGPTWVPQDKRMTVTKFLMKKAADAETHATCDAKAVSDDASSSEKELVSSPAIAAVNTQVNRLHWMLDYTMGSHGDFERRRKELSIAREGSIVTDDDVVQSFTQSVQDGGVVREFLLQGRLAFIIHQTLFVHGGIITRGDGDGDEVLSTLGYVPGDPYHYEDVFEWTNKLNAWYQQQLHDWMDQPTWTRDHATRGGHALMEYVLPYYKHSVIMGRHLDKAGMPLPLPKTVAKRLEASGITRVIVGHTPHGTCPTVIQQPQPAERDGYEGITFKEVIMCDTSYSDMRAPDNRGLAASELVLHADGRVDIHGVLETGRGIAFTTDSTSQSYIGRLLRDGMRVKAQLAEDKDQYLVFKVENGYSYTYEYRSITQLLEIGFVDEATARNKEASLGQHAPSK